MEDDSQAGFTALDTGTEMTMRRSSDLREDGEVGLSGRIEREEESSERVMREQLEKKVQVCSCGWQKITTVRGLKIHQGKKGCGGKVGQGNRIEQYFLRSLRSKSAEVQRQVENHSSQDIRNPVLEEREEVRGTEGEGEPSQSKREKAWEQKARVSWPQAKDKMTWESVDRDLAMVLEGLKGTAMAKLERMGEVIYSYGLDRFGSSDRRKREPAQHCQSRRQKDIRELVLRRRQLRKQWKRATIEEKEGIDALQEELRCRLATLRRAENLRRKRKEKERVRTLFYKDPFKFVKGLFNQEKGGILRTSKEEVEEYLRKTHSDPGREGGLGFPPDMPPLGEIESQMDVVPPRWKEVEAVVRKAKASSAPGPNGVPYRVYKNAPGVLRFLWKLFKVVWHKQSIPTAWCRAGGVLIPKEKESVRIDQFRMISLLNVEGKIFFSIVAKRLVQYLEKNGLIDTTVQKAGIPGFAGCIEHTSVIWHQIQTAKQEGRELHVVFLDLANAFGSVPHSLIWSACEYFRVPVEIVNIMKEYFKDIRLCIGTGEFVSDWQKLEVGIMAGCTISPLAFTMAMEMVIRASKWVVGGERRREGLRLPPIRAFMDDMTLLTTTVPCTKRLLERINTNLRWARMRIKPSKSRSISVTKGKVVEQKFTVEGEEIPSIRVRPVKSLGRWYNADLSDREQVEQLRKDVVEGLEKIDRSGLPGKLKLWCMQFGLFPRVMWPMSVYEVPLSKVEKLEKVVNSYVKKWLGVPRCLSSVALYGKGILQLPINSLVEEFKCAKVRTELLLTGSKDRIVSGLAPNPSKGRKWKPKVAVQEAEAALRHGEIMGNVQIGRGGLGRTSGKPMWRKADQKEKRRLVVEQIRRQEEASRQVKAVSLAKQGQWLNWEGVERKQVTWRDLWSMESNRLKFLLGATYDVLPSPDNLRIWTDGDPSCTLCSGVATLRHILSGCKVSLAQGRYTWRHNQVLKCLAAGIESRRQQVNAEGSHKKGIQFVREGEKSKRAVKSRSTTQEAKDWQMLVDVGGKLVVPQEIVTTNLRPDIVYWSTSQQVVYFIELTVPWESSLEEAYERKKLKYEELRLEAEQKGWRARVFPVEVGCRGFVGRSVISLLGELGVGGKNLRKTVREMSEEAARTSNWIWMRRAVSAWGKQ